MNKIKYTTALLLGGLLSFSSCTDNFADFNSTEGAYTDELQKYDNQTNLVPFSTIQKGIIYQTGVDGTDWQYQSLNEVSNTNGRGSSTTPGVFNAASINI